MNKKIAIMTWHTFNNYGGVLQAYALRKKLIGLGNNQVDFVNYLPTCKNIKISSKFSFHFAKEFISKKKLNNKLYLITDEKFDAFRNKYFTMSKKAYTKKTLFALNAEYDKFICGSDQIWSPALFDENYFLSFVQNDDKKIAYAPSIGLNEIVDESTKVLMRELISHIPHLSVREERGQKIIEELIGKKPKVVLDPTLLLSKEEWKSQFNLENFNKKNYVLVYCLGDMKKAYQIAKKMKKDIIVIPKTYADYAKHQKESCIPSPVEFLKLIYHADMVITDSFHGTVFSMNFNVPFIVLKRFKDDQSSQNSRIYSILKMMQLEDRLYLGNMNTIDNHLIHFEKVNNLIEIYRKESLEFLIHALNFENKSENDKNYITNLCTGCGACAVVCPQKCITIKQNQEGFFEYHKNNTKCTNCNLCQKVCGQVSNHSIKINDGKLYSFYSHRDEVLQNSSSGGFAYEVSKWGIKNGYTIVGCTYDEKSQKAKHILVDKIEDITKLSGSKYLQSDTQEAFSKVVSLEKAIVIGTPCQIASIDNLLRFKKKRDHFILIDLICHGVPSYLLWDKYLKTKSNTDKVKFRDKKYGWRIKAITTDGKTIEKDNESLFYQFYDARNVYIESCYECEYRNASAADIRIGDFWGPKFADNQKGVTFY